MTSEHFDKEIEGLIRSAKLDMGLSGIDTSSGDPLIEQAVITYSKAHFGYDNPEAERFIDSYEQMKRLLSLSSDYNET